MAFHSVCVLSCVFWLLAGPAVAGGSPEPWREEVLRWIGRMQSDQPITVAEFERWNSSKDELETEFEEAECERRGWSASKSDEKCMAYTNKREAEGDKATSLYYEWLGQQLCKTCATQILGAERKSWGTPNSEYDLIRVKFGARVVAIAYFFDEDHLDIVGRLPVQELDGRAIEDAAKEELADRRAEGTREPSQPAPTGKAPENR